MLTSQERLQLPVLLLQNYKKKSSNWKANYDNQYRDEEVKKAKRLEKDQKYKVVYMSDQKKEVNYIATKVEKDQAYKNVYEYDPKNRVPNTVSQEKKGYPNTASSQITFSRNVIMHINKDGKYVCVLIYLSIFFYSLLNAR